MHRQEGLHECVLVSFPSSSSPPVRRCQVSVVLSAITALNSGSRLCAECVHTGAMNERAFLEAELNPLYHGEDNTREAAPQIDSK